MASDLIVRFSHTPPPKLFEKNFFNVYAKTGCIKQNATGFILFYIYFYHYNLILPDSSGEADYVLCRTAEKL